MHTYTLTISYPNNANSIQSQGGVFNGYVYFETGENNISGGIKLFNHEGTNTKQKSNLQIGDLVKIGTEEFYVITDEKGNIEDINGQVRALAKYNLLIGYICDDGLNKSRDVSSETSGYNMQNSDVVSNWWTPGSIRVAYNVTNIQKYVNDYIDKLKYENNIVMENIVGSLITKEQIEKLKDYYTDTKDSEITAGDKISEWAPKWFYQTSYWTSTDSSSSTTFAVSTDGTIKSASRGDRYHTVGLRPGIIF